MRASVTVADANAVACVAFSARGRLCRGYNIGVRLVDEFLAKSNLQSCVNFRETAQVIAKVGFKMFLGIAADGQHRTHEGDCSMGARSFAHRSRVEANGELISPHRMCVLSVCVSLFAASDEMA